MRVVIAEQSMIYREYLVSKFIKRGHEVLLTDIGIVPVSEFDFYITDYCIESQAVLDALDKPDRCVVILNEVTRQNTVSVDAIRFMKSFDSAQVDRFIHSLEEK